MTATVSPSPVELADLAVAMRPDWDPAHVPGAISAATAAGLDFGVIAEVLIRLARDERAQPRDLAEMVRNHQHKQVPAQGTYERGAAAVRQAMTGRSAS